MTQDQTLAGRVAVVTGAGTGIGEGIARAFAAAGARLALAGRSRAPLEAVTARIAAAGGSALALPTDVTDEASVAALFDQVVSAWGGVDILVNNAGVAAPGAADELSLADWRRVLDTNLTGAFLCSRAALRLMKPRRAGRILNVGSISAKMPRRHSAAYTTSKFGLEGLTRALALEARDYGVAVSVLQPGNVDTPLWSGREEMARKEGIMTPADLARIALLMVSLPPDVNLLESLVLPLGQPFLGRG